MRKRQSAAGAQLSEAPVVEAERKENPAQWKARRAGNWGNKTQQKAHAAQPQIPEDLQLR